MASQLTIFDLGFQTEMFKTPLVRQIFDAAQRIILQTAHLPGFEFLQDDPRVTHCDERKRDLSPEVPSTFIADLIVAASMANTVYVVAENSVSNKPIFMEIVQQAAGKDIAIELFTTTIDFDNATNLCQIDSKSSSIQYLDAAFVCEAVEKAPFGGGLIAVSPASSCFVRGIDSQAIAAEIKVALTRLYPENHRLWLVGTSDIPKLTRLRSSTLREFVRCDIDYPISLWIPVVPELEAYRFARTLQRIVAYLRAPDGCPWDREQSHKSLRGALIEEAFEVVDAIDEGDNEHLAEELGDLLLQVYLHAQIAEETDEFVLEDVYEQITRKLVRRHPHVFGDDVAETPDAVVRTWERVKANERRVKGATDSTHQHPLDKLPRSMPAMQKVARVLAKRQTVNHHSSESVRDMIANRLFDGVAEAVAAGFDPEVELERIARLRLSQEYGTSGTDQRNNQ